MRAYDSESEEEMDIDDEEDEMETLFNARKMDESFNLAAHLAGVKLPSETYWTEYVKNCYNSSEMDGDEDNF